MIKFLSYGCRGFQTDRQTNHQAERPTGRHTYIVRDTDWLSLKVKEANKQITQAQLSTDGPTDYQRILTFLIN